MKPEIQMFIAVSQQWKIESARQGLWERAQSCETDSLRPISPAAAAAETLEITTRDFKKLVLATRVAGMSKLLARGSPTTVPHCIYLSIPASDLPEKRESASPA